MKKKIVAGSNFGLHMKSRIYLVDGFHRNREYFLNMLRSSSITQEQYNKLLQGEAVTIDGTIFQIENVEAI